MDNRVPDSQTSAAAYMDKAETYRKLGLRAQVEFELEQARRRDPFIVQDARYQAFMQAEQAEKQSTPLVESPLRIAAGILLLTALIDAFLIARLLLAGNFAALHVGSVLNPIVDVVIGINLWRGRAQWKRYTVWWALLGLILFGALLLLAGDFLDLVFQVAFSGSLLLLLTGKPSRTRNALAVTIYVVAYIGTLCLLFILAAFR